MVEHRKDLFPWLLLGSGVLLLFVGLAWLFLNQQAAPVVTPTPYSDGTVERVSLKDAKAAFDSNSAVFVDVRANSSYEASHIPGAVSIPLDELSTRLRELDPTSWIIPY